MGLTLERFILVFYLKQPLFLDCLINLQIRSSANFWVGNFNFPDLEKPLHIHYPLKMKPTLLQDTGPTRDHPEAS